MLNIRVEAPLIIFVDKKIKVLKNQKI